MEEKQKTQKIELDLYRGDTDLYKSSFKIGQSNNIIKNLDTECKKFFIIANKQMEIVVKNLKKIWG
jgi:hypothetical protein